MGMAEIEHFVTVLAGCGIRKIDILGGEPSLLPWFIETVSLLVHRGMETTISSNGTAPGALREIFQGISGGTMKVGISLNSESVAHDLDDLIIQHVSFVKGVVMRDMDVPAALKRYFGRKSPVCYLLYRDAVEADDLRETPPFPEFYSMAMRMKENIRNVDCVYCSGFVPDVWQNPALEHVRCPAGTTKLSVMPDGSVYPCYLLFRDESFRIGNILTDDFRRIWQHPRLNFFRTYRGNICPKKDCALHSRCHGGCPAVSLLISGRLDAPDPRCTQVDADALTMKTTAFIL